MGVYILLVQFINTVDGLPTTAYLVGGLELNFQSRLKFLYTINRLVNT